MLVAVCADVLEDSGVAVDIFEAIKICHHLGVDSVELSHPHIVRSKSPKRIYDLCQSLELNICGIHNSLPRGFTIFDEQGHIRPAFQEHLRTRLETAAALNAPVVTFGIGSSRWIPPNHDRAWAATKFIEGLLQMVESYAEHQIIMSVEIISSQTADFFNSVGEVLPYLEQANTPWLGLTCDSFHSIQEGLSIISELQKAQYWLAHLHLAEKNRRPPGQGNIDYRNLLQELKRLNYSKTVSIELKIPSSKYTGTSDPISDLKSGIEHINSLRSEFG